MMNRRFLTIGLGLALAALALSAGLMLRVVLSERSAPSAGVATSVSFGAPFNLVDYNGDPITEAAFEGRPSLLFFGFTHCPDVCPTTVYEIESWLRDLGPAGEEMQAFFVSVDPERDTVEFLSDYLKPQSDRVIGITGTPEEVWQMARSWRVYWKKIPLEDGDYTMDHFASIYVLDRAGQFFDKISYGEEAESAKAKIRAALGS